MNKDNAATPNGTLGKDKSCTWHPWVYSERLDVAKKVAIKKEELSKSNVTAATKRNNLLAFIKLQESRQEFEPVLGNLINCGFAEPLHNSNNGWGHMHQKMLELALSKSKIAQKCKEIDQLPANSPFIAYITVLKEILHVSRLVKKVNTWFSEGRKTSFSYRFTGKETKIFCRKFMFVLHALSNPTDSPAAQLKLAAIAYCCIHLRDAVSYFSRVNITQLEVNMCKNACLHYFNANVLLLGSVTPTTWTVGIAIPRHLQILYDRYGKGLGLNSMQGREAKHVRLSQFAKHSTKSKRWPMVLRHDYISNVFIRKHDPGCLLYTKYNVHYIPNETELQSSCYCGFPLDRGVHSCSICSSSIFKDVEKAALAGSLANTNINSILGMPK